MKFVNYFSLPLLLTFSTFNAQAEVLFQENFDNLPEWQTLNHNTVGPLPSTFDYGYTTDVYHPTEVPGSQPSMSITGSDLNKVFGGSGKAFVATYETRNNTGGWISDGFLTKDIPPSNEVYVKFKMKFQPGFNANGTSGDIKLFRITSWDGVTPRSKFFSGGNSAPIYLFHWSKNSFGVRQQHAFRCDAQQTNYYCTNPEIKNPPRTIPRGSGSMKANFSNDVAQLTTKIPDLVNGGYLPPSGNISHEQVYGEIWHTMEFYVKLNSAPGAQDGILKAWLDGEPIVDMDGIPWIGNNGDMNAKWNNVTFGGNGLYF